MKDARILIVEDEPAIASALATLLMQAGYSTDSAMDGHEAIRKFDNALYDMVLLDVMLPAVDGYGVCYHIRNKPNYTLVIMLTACDQLTDKLVGMELGADVYITKPFEPDELLAQVRSLLRLLDGQRTTQSTPLPLTCGSISLWDADHRVEISGKSIPLAPKEYELLRVLLMQPGKVFGRETLLRQVWGYENTVDTRTVDMHVQRLRAKLEVDPSDPKLLTTVRGYGYRLVSPRIE